MPPNSLRVIEESITVHAKAVRKELAKQLKYFCLIYLPHYFELEPADFFDDLIADIENDSLDALLVIGFRGSAKSTFVSTAYIIYAAVVKPECKNRLQ